MAYIMNTVIQAETPEQLCQQAESGRIISTARLGK